MAMVTTEAFDELMAAAAVANVSAGDFTGPLHGSKMVLYTNTPALTKTMVLSELIQPTYTGYGASVLTWGDAKRDENGNISVDSGLMPVQMGDSTTPTSVTGYALVDSTGATLYAAETLAESIDLLDALSYAGLVLEFSFNNAAPGSASVVS